MSFSGGIGCLPRELQAGALSACRISIATAGSISCGRTTSAVKLSCGIWAARRETSSSGRIGWRPTASRGGASSAPVISTATAPPISCGRTTPPRASSSGISAVHKAIPFKVGIGFRRLASLVGSRSHARVHRADALLKRNGYIPLRDEADRNPRRLLHRRDVDDRHVVRHRVRDVGGLAVRRQRHPAGALATELRAPEQLQVR